MTRARTFFRSSFGSALFGGIVAVVIGIVAIATGLISVDNSSGSAPVAATPITKTEPASSTGQTVNQVYQEDAQGVARLCILVDPAVGAVDLPAVAETFRQAFGDPAPWREPDVVRAVSAPPRRTASGKILHLHRESTDAPSARS